MTYIHASQMLTREGWRDAVRLRVQSGRIASVQVGAPPQAGDERHAIVVPALGNLHSHAFQRAMAGFAEVSGDSADNFWSWRDAMYRLAHRMNPDQFEAVAAQAYVEMLECGFARVGEFHYLHHDPTGAPYSDPGEMSARLFAAAETSGIGLTLLPVFYAHSTFGGAPPKTTQRRFLSTLESYEALLQRCQSLAARLPTAVVGVAPHSLRAVTPQELSSVAALAGTAPVHIHVAEQVREVEECLAWSGRRPVEWLLDHAPVGTSWCLVHATHVTPQEAQRVARSGAVVGLCPVTEANLGDGVFPIASLLERQGCFGIGTDSNVHISLVAELSLLEYSQRLTARMRNVVRKEPHSTGRAIMEIALAGGARALGAGGGAIAEGEPADFVSLNEHHPALACHAADALLDAWIFASAGDVVDCVWVAGAKVVSQGRHIARERVAREFIRAMKELHS
ncbi:MAG: formimidoylglutamate deiminase [Steroidobacteraceae bacterium]|nr:formimidoylglutamate deiminase [Steroidobacteraceae bacterium]